MNVALPVIHWLRSEAIDVSSIYERGLGRLDDASILELAASEGRFVMTHDADFGTLVFAERRRLTTGVLFVRPGDLPPDRVIASLKVLVHADVDWRPPLLAVFANGRLRIRRP